MAMQTFLDAVRARADFVSPLNKNVVIIDGVTFILRPGEGEDVCALEGVTTGAYSANPRSEPNKARRAPSGKVPEALSALTELAKAHGVSIDISDAATIERMAAFAEVAGFSGSSLQGWRLAVDPLPVQTPAKKAAPGVRAERRRIGDVRSAIQSLWWRIDDIQGHTPLEFFRAEVESVLQRAMAPVEAIVKEGLAERFADDLNNATRALERAQEVIVRWHAKRAEGVPEKMGRGDAWGYLVHTRGVSAEEADRLLEVPSVKEALEPAPGLPSHIPFYMKADLDRALAEQEASSAALSPEVPVARDEPVLPAIPATLPPRAVRQMLQSELPAQRAALAQRILDAHPHLQNLVEGLMRDVFQTPFEATAASEGPAAPRAAAALPSAEDRPEQASMKAQLIDALQAHGWRTEAEHVIVSDAHADEQRFVSPVRLCEAVVNEQPVSCRFALEAHDTPEGGVSCAVYLLDQFGGRVVVVGRTECQPGLAISIAAQIVDGFAAIGPDTAPLAWEALKMPSLELRAISPDRVRVMYSVLDDANFNSEAVAVLAKRYCAGSLAREALAIYREHVAAGGLSSSLKERRERVLAEAKAAHDVALLLQEGAEEGEAWFVREVRQPLLQALELPVLDSAFFVRLILERAVRIAPEALEAFLETLRAGNTPAYERLTTTVAIPDEEVAQTSLFAITGGEMVPVVSVGRFVKALAEDVARSDDALLAAPFSAQASQKDEDAVVARQVEGALDACMEALSGRLKASLVAMHSPVEALAELRRQLAPWALGDVAAAGLLQRTVSSMDKAWPSKEGFDLTCFKGALVPAYPPEFEDIPEHWIVMNAPRPLLGERRVDGGGEFIHGRFYAALDPSDATSAAFIEENRRLDAYVLIRVRSEEVREQIAYRMIERDVGHEYVECYKAAEPQIREDVINQRLRSLFGASAYDLRMDALNAFADCSLQKALNRHGLDRARALGMTDKTFETLALRRDLLESFHEIGGRVGVSDVPLSEAARAYIAEACAHIDTRVGNAAVLEQDRAQRIRALLSRPLLYEFSSDCPEFSRWYEIGGRPRELPLTEEALVAHLMERGADEAEVRREMCCTQCSAVSEAEWHWFETQFPGEVAALRQEAICRASSGRHSVVATQPEAF